VHLLFREAEDEGGGPTVAGAAFTATGKTPGLAPNPACNATVFNEEFPFLHGFLDQTRVGLRVLPTIRVAGPLALLAREKPRFNPLARGRIGRLAFRRQRLNQHRAIR